MNAAPVTPALHPSTTAHDRPVEAVLREFGTSLDGLDPAQVEARRRTAGPNAIPRAAGPGVLVLLRRQLESPLVYVLLAAAALALLLGKTIDGGVVLGVVVLNTLIGFAQEYKANRAVAALADLVPETATVRRAGLDTVVPAEDLVPGDVVVLQSGDKVPADVRLAEVRGLQVEEAALTGESLPVEKSADPVAPEAVLGDRRSMAYSGTMVTLGRGVGVVVATGEQTELGRISQLLRTTTELETPLVRQMARVGRGLTAGISVVALLLFGLGLGRGIPLVDAALAAVTLAVAAIPEGLPAIITIALAIGVQRMAGRRAIVRKLPAVETLGAVTVICSDKTGTLTRGEMTVQALWTPGDGHLEVTGVGYAPEGQLRRDGQFATPPTPSLHDLLAAGALCNDARLAQEEGHWRVHGDPTEGALLVAARKAGVDLDALRAGQPRYDAVPFESERQFMATLHARPDAPPVLYMKGAPEAVLARCAPVALREAALGEAHRLADAGLRVLAVAEKALPEATRAIDDEMLRDGFVPLGLEAMIDPPRPEAISAVAACRSAGIAVKMITGDHPGTARAVGRTLGLVAPGDGVLAGAEIAARSDEELAAALRTTSVFARVAPEHKLRLVRILQEMGHVVAVTGDGVNDAPALKQADIGVAMGITGTAVSKEAADMVLADDNFASVAAAVEEGRRVYDNLVKSLAFVLPTNLGEALVVLLAVAAFPIVGGTLLQPMLPVQILWINLVATVALALPLAFEAMEPGVMRRPPRDPRASILGRFVLFRTVAVAVLMAGSSIALFLYEHRRGLEAGLAAPEALAAAQTIAVTTVVLFQVFYVLQCRALRDSVLHVGLWSNPWVYAGIAATLALQAGFVYLPFMHHLFGTAPLPPEAWVRAAATALVALSVVAGEKAWRRRRAASLPNGPSAGADREAASVSLPLHRQQTRTRSARETHRAAH